MQQTLARVASKVDPDGGMDHDELQILLRSQLHKLEPSNNPLDMMFCYNIIELIASISDVSQKVSHRVLCMVAR